MAIPGLVMKPRVRIGKPGECWEWLGNKTAGGYGKKQFNGRTVLAHRWIWQQLFGPIPNGKVINHKCQNRGCVNPHHLEVTTQAQNSRLGDLTVLTPGDVEEIKAAKDGKKFGDGARLAREYGVSKSLIHDIWNGRAWRTHAKPFYGASKYDPANTPKEAA